MRYISIAGLLLLTISCSKLSEFKEIDFDSVVLDKILVPMEGDAKSYIFGSDNMLDIVYRGNRFSDYRPYEREGDYVVFPSCRELREAKWKLIIINENSVRINHDLYVLE